MRFFFNNTLRTYDIAVGKLFNDIWVIHYNKDNPKDIQEYRVPYVFGAKLHWYLRKYDTVDNDFNVKITIPKMSYSRTAPQYDSKRQLNKYGKVKGNKKFSPEVENYIQYWSGTAAPYKIPYEINIWTHTMNEMNQILEQILSFFHAQTHNLNIVECPMFGIERNVRITLDSTSSNYTTEYNVNGDRVLRHKINLTVEGNIYSVINESSVIKEIDAFYIENEEQQNRLLYAINNGEQITDDMYMSSQTVDESSLDEEEIPEIDEGYSGEVCNGN